MTKELQIFFGIEELYTLKKSAQKKARRTQAEDLSIIKDGALVCQNGKIIWVGENKNIPSHFLKKSKKINLQTKMLLPGFVECHTHSIFAGNRNDEFDLRSRGISYQQIAQSGGGILSTVRATREQSSAQLLKSLRARVQNFAQQGVTTLEIKTGYGLNQADEIKCLKIIGQIRQMQIVATFLGAHSVPPEYSSDTEYVDFLIQKVLPQIKNLAQRVDIFVEKGFFSVPNGQRYLKAAKKLGLASTVHADQLSLSGGAALALEMKSQSADHLLQINDETIRKLAKSQVTCVLLPAADFFMKINYPPARKLIDSGARVALATDFNPGTAPSQSLSLVWWLARLEMKMTLPEVIVAQTLGAAYALGLQDQVGSLEVGKNANFVCMNADYQAEQTFYLQNALRYKK